MRRSEPPKKHRSQRLKRLPLQVSVKKDSLAGIFADKDAVAANAVGKVAFLHDDDVNGPFN
jgi:hypothetical protein